MDWTSDQKKVIELRNKNILVSAAAGSGKTAVLVERIISIVTDHDKKIDIDRLLIVTFTNAAAAEMRERIGAAIEKRLMEYPEDTHLQKQQTLIHNAQITTIHSFCLNVIRNNFNAIDLDPSFRIADETELKLIKSDIVALILEDNYEKAEEPFLEFIESYSTGKSDDVIEDFIIRLYSFSQSYPDPEEWLDSLRGGFEVSSEDSLENKAYIKFLVSYIGQVVGETEKTIDEAIALCNEENGPYMYLNMFAEDKALILSLAGADNYKTYAEKLYGLKWARLSSKKDERVDVEKRESAKTLRDEVKSTIDNIRKSYFFQDSQAMIEDIIGSRKVMNVLIDLVIEFSKVFSEKKASKNILDFNDLEHKALDILVKKDQGGYIKTGVAVDLSDHYEEILIDEYQDSNLVQETLLNSISREEFDGHNLFMVGDVKQSIYKFRLARPELFMEKYNSYPTEWDDSYNKEGKYERIDLHKNFRSRKNVLDSINFIFEQIMDAKLGGIEYDDASALYTGASFLDTDENVGGATELILVDLDSLEDEDFDYTSKEIEAKAIADRIKEIVLSPEPLKVYDKNLGAYRNAKNKDIVVLLRTVTGWADTFEAVLMREGIAAHCDSSVGYFSTLEIQTILSVLNIVDNPIQDIPLTAVLRSPIVGFSSQELAVIKSEFKQKDMYFAMTSYIEEGSVIEIKSKLIDFMALIDSFRNRVPYTSIHDLIWTILSETGYYNYVSAMPAGAKRKANIDMLIEKAVGFEESSYKGLFNFIRYIEKIREYEIDFGEASVLSENEDVVRIMSIHKSKGLEFPIVFAAGLGKMFNNQDARSKMVIHPELGAGPDYIDHKLRVKSPTLIKKILSKKIVLENLGEELRVLYVALTRAKEKLILTGTVKKIDKTMGKLKEVVKNTKLQKLSFTSLSSATSYLDWILPALARHDSFRTILNEYGIYPEGFKLKYFDTTSFDSKIINLSQSVKEEVESQVIKQNHKEELINWEGETFDEAIHSEIKKRLGFVYAYEKESNLHAKMTVTQLKVLGQNVDEDYSYSLPLTEENDTVPKFLSSDDTVSGSNRGTIMHKIMQNIDFSVIDSFNKLEYEMDQLVKQGKLKKDEKDLVDIKKVYRFILSPLAARMNKAQKDNKLFKEKQFVMGISANEISSNFKSDETILIQGIIDVYFEEAGEIILVDYKTDKIEPGMDEVLIHKYSKQLEYYSRAIEQITGQKVCQKIIYSFALEKEITMA